MSHELRTVLTGLGIGAAMLFISIGLSYLVVKAGGKPPRR
jgi:hypothetical protein